MTSATRILLKDLRALRAELRHARRQGAALADGLANDEATRPDARLASRILNLRLTAIGKGVDRVLEFARKAAS